MSLKNQETSLELFKRFTQPKTEMSLKGQVTTAQTSLNNETLRLQRQLDRLALLKKQVDRCTIRAPHDGVLFYYKGGVSNGGDGGGSRGGGGGGAPAAAAEAARPPPAQRWRWAAEEVEGDREPLLRSKKG